MIMTLMMMMMTLVRVMLLVMMIIDDDDDDGDETMVKAMMVYNFCNYSEGCDDIATSNDKIVGNDDDYHKFHKRQLRTNMCTPLTKYFQVKFTMCCKILLQQMEDKHGPF